MMSKNMDFATPVSAQVVKMMISEGTELTWEHKAQLLAPLIVQQCSALEKATAGFEGVQAFLAKTTTFISELVHGTLSKRLAPQCPLTSYIDALEALQGA